MKLKKLEDALIQGEDHTVGMIRTAYGVFHDDQDAFLGSFSQFYDPTRKTKRGSRRFFSNHDYTACDAHRLSGNPNIKPSWTNCPNQYVRPGHDRSEEDLEERCGYASKMTIGEQCANIFYIRSFYGKYNRLKKLDRTDTNGCYTDEIAKMEKVMQDAEALWDRKWTKTISERLQMVTSAIREYSPCHKRTHHDSDDDLPAKYQRVGPN